MTASAPGAVRAAQHRADVARLLDALDDDDERRRAAGRATRAPSTGCPDDRDEALGPLAERELGEDRLVRGVDRAPCPRGADRARPGRPGPASSGSQTNASTTSTPASSARRSSRAPSTRVRPVRSRSRRSRSAERGLDPRVRGAGQDAAGWGSARRHHARPADAREGARGRGARPSARRRAPRSPASIDAAGRRVAAAERRRQPVAVEPRRVRGQQDEAVGLEEPRRTRRGAPARSSLEPPGARPGPCP